MVADGQTGYLARGLDEWEARLDALLADAALRARVGAAGRREAELRYDPRAHVATLAAVLRGAAGARR